MSCMASHGLCVQYSWGWKSCMFSYIFDFAAKTQNPLIHDPRFEQFTIPSLDDFVDSDSGELLLCPIKILRKYLSWTSNTVLGFPIRLSQ